VILWQSKTWNAQEAVFRMFTVVGIVLVFLALPDSETHLE
jgi:predicted small integral membrane protein